MAIATTLLSLVGTLVAQAKAPYSKTVADGGRVFHVKRTITELRSRPRGANPDAPAEEIYTDREWQIVTNALRLQRAGAAESFVIWSDVWEYPADRIQSLPDTRGSLYIADVLLRNDKAFILYYDGFYTYRVANVGLDNGKWQQISNTVLAKSSETHPILELEFAQKGNPEISIAYLVSDGRGNRKPRSIRFSLKGDKWRRK